ncbi:MAG: hypothetical protein HY912_09255 [Desulfomonile tiedjei]|uniref:Uncharacterized protein n=1 Tax=Desulfomonile tiedjei TaxID=2358 RepID=A0A9D6V2P0_9BACT|nr:hypothetical protein [Desulfomonile tiedjei]
MRQSIYRKLAISCWLVFFLRLTENASVLWPVFCMLIGAAALICMMELLRNPALKYSEVFVTATASTKGRWGEGWAMTFCAILFFIMIGRSLPAHWAQISPLFGVLAVYGVSRLFPDRKSEEQTEAPASPGSPNQGV